MRNWALALLATALAASSYAQTPQTLHEAASNGDADAVRTLVKAGADIDARNGDGQTPLFLAAYFGHADTVRALAAAGADIQARNGVGETPLHAAALVGHAPAVRGRPGGVTVSIGSITVNGQSINGNGNDKAEAVRALVEAGADVKATSNGEGTPLHSAGMNNEAEPEVVADAVRTLTEAGADVNATDDLGMTPLHYAVFFGSPEAVRAFIAKGANVNAKAGSKFSGETPLQLAARRPFDHVDGYFGADGQSGSRAVRILCSLTDIEDAEGHCDQ